MNTLTVVRVREDKVKIKIEKPLIRKLCKGKWIITNKKVEGFAVCSLTP